MVGSVDESTEATPSFQEGISDDDRDSALEGMVDGTSEGDADADGMADGTTSGLCSFSSSMTFGVLLLSTFPPSWRIGLAGGPRWFVHSFFLCSCLYITLLRLIKGRLQHPAAP